MMLFSTHKAQRANAKAKHNQDKHPGGDGVSRGEAEVECDHNNCVCFNI